MKYNHTELKTTMMLVLLFVLNVGFAAEDSRMVYDDSEVAEIRITIDLDVLGWIFDSANVHSDSIHLAQFHFKNKYIDETVENVGFRLRGNTSRESAKKSFKISFNTFVSGRKFYSLDKMNLNGEHNDPSIIRSKICCDWFNEIGLTASRAAHAAVYINDEYYGLYISVEHIDDEFVNRRYRDTSGNLWKCLWPADLTYRGADPSNYYPYFGDERPYELKTNKDRYDYSQLARFIDILNNTSDADFIDSVEQILEVPEALKYFAMDILTGSWDDYRFLKNNYYLYYEPRVDKFHLIPYDYDNTFGVDWFGIDWATVDPYDYPASDDSGRPLMRLLEVPEYRNLYTHMLQFYAANVTALNLNDSRIDSIKTMIAPWAEQDLYRTYDWGFTIEDFNESYSSDSYSNQHVKRGLKEFIKRRNTSLTGQLEYTDSEPIIYALDYRPKLPGPEDSITVTAAVFCPVSVAGVDIAFRPGNLTVIETIPMTYQPVSSSKKIEDADRWIGVIPPLGPGGFGAFHINIKGDNTALSGYPRNGYITLSVIEPQVSGLKINEFMASNNRTVSDEAGEFDDWLEIINVGNQSVSLNGLYLTDKIDNFTKWGFSLSDSILAPGEFLLIWCDDDEEQGGYHTNFKLSANGEFLAIIAEDGVTVLDSISFGEQSADISYGRYPDGYDAWQYFSIPTPGASNDVGTSVNGSRTATEFQLFRNYPNPFNMTTTIYYSLSGKAFVRLAVFDLSGRLVESLLDREQAAGEHYFIWQTAHLSSGIYFCELKTEKTIRCIKMMLLK